MKAPLQSMAAERQESMPAPVKPFFSIVVPTWNRGRLIGETIDSLLNQDFPRSQYEVIVVDDGSTDDTGDRLQPYSGRIRVFHQSNSGAPTARNLGIQQARGDYLVSFDHDDLLLPYALRVYKDVIDAFGLPPVVLAQPCWFHGDPSAILAARAPARIRCVKCRDFLGKNVQTPITNSILVLRKNEVMRVGAYAADSAAADDDILIFKLGTAGPMIKIVDPFTVGHRMHEQNARKNIELITQGLAALIRNERRGIYPGGWRRMFDRRGLIGSNFLSVLWHDVLGARHVSVKGRMARIPGLLLQARGMIVAGMLRKVCSYFYMNEARSLDFPAPRNGFDSVRPDGKDSKS